MKAPKEPVLLHQKCLDHQTQFNDTLSQLSQELSLSAIKRLKAQVLVLSDWLFRLHEENANYVLAQALKHDTNLLPHTNQAFCAGIIAAKFSHRLHYHGQHARLFIASALTMNISLHLTGISQLLYNQQKLTTAQIKQYQQYPITSAQFLNKYHIVEKTALTDIINHRELLDSSGFPAKLCHNKLTYNAKLLGTICKFTELSSPKAQRSAHRIKQALSYLLKHQQQYDITILNQLVNLVDKPLPGLIFKLKKTQYGLITKLNHYDNELSYHVFSLEQGQLVINKNVQQIAIDYQKNYFVSPTLLTSRTTHQYFSDYIDEPLTDISEQPQRLKPSDDLTSLLHELSAQLPNKETIGELIARQPVLGASLINYLQTQYSNSQFNNSFHAIQMVGFSQAKPLLSRLALQAQLTHFDFPTASTLRQKIGFAMASADLIAQHCQHILPHQLTTFVQLNLAPLYLERSVINGCINHQINFKQCHPFHSYSLVGHNNNAKQQKLSLGLAKVWAPEQIIINALNHSSDSEIQPSPSERELTAGLTLALYLTHHIYHQLPLDLQTGDGRLNASLRTLKIKPPQLQQLITDTLTYQPMCEL